MAWLILSPCACSFSPVCRLRDTGMFNKTMSHIGKFADNSRVISRPITSCDWRWQGVVFQVSWALAFLGSLLGMFAFSIHSEDYLIRSLVLILPFMVVHDLDLTKRSKFCLYFVSLIGLLDIGISLIRFLNVELGDGSEFRSFSTIGRYPSYNISPPLILMSPNRILECSRC